MDMLCAKCLSLLKVARFTHHPRRASKGGLLMDKHNPGKLIGMGTGEAAKAHREIRKRMVIPEPRIVNKKFSHNYR